MTRDTATITQTENDVTVTMHGLEVTICKSGGNDGATVVFVDGEPTCRILLNDEPVHVGTAYQPTED